MSKLFFFGRFPAYKEVGGVTTFTYNFASKFKSKNFEVIDFYPAKDKKVPDNVKARFISGNKLKRIFRIFLFNLLNEGVYFFNFSSVRSLLFLFVLPKCNKTIWLAVFHNGEQSKKYNESNFFLKWLMKNALKKIDRLGILSNAQRTFFEKITDGEICRISPYINPKIEIGDTVKKIKSSDTVKIMLSGFPTKIYRLLEAISIFSRLESEKMKFELHICLYGFDTDNLLDEITNQASRVASVHIHSHLSGNEFNSLLFEMDLYLRLNSVDSFGLVVAEAIEHGVCVIATDVCERYPGANLIAVDDFERVYKELSFYIKNKLLTGDLKVQESIEGLVSYDEFVIPPINSRCFK